MITLGGDADETFPFLTEDTIRYGWNLPDPSLEPGATEATLAVFRSIRDELKGKLARLVTTLPG